MPKAEKLIENIQRRLKNNESVDKYVKKLRELGQLDRLFAVGKEEMTLLMYYARENRPQKVKELLTGPNPASPLIINKEKSNALLIAMSSAYDNSAYDSSIIVELLKSNPEKQLLQKNKNGSISLHSALESGNFKLVQILLSYAAKEQLEIKDNEEDTAFVYAGRSENIELLTWLVEQYPLIFEVRAKDGFTPLHVACRFSNLALVNLLLEKGDKKQVITKDARGMIPLLDACINKKSDIIIALLKYNPTEQLTCEDQLGQTIFHSVSGLGLITELKILLNCAKENKLNLRNVFYKKAIMGLIPLSMVISSPQIELSERIKIVEMFLELGGTEQLESQDDRGSTALLEAIAKGEIDLINKLMSYKNTAQYLLANKAGQTPLFVAIQKGLLSTVELLLRCGPTEQLDPKGSIGMTPLCYAVMLSPDLKMTALLLDYCNETQLVRGSEEPYTPMHLALSMGRFTHFNLLMKSRFSQILINLRETQTGSIPLHSAVEKDNDEAAGMLIEARSEINAPNHLGWTPLHVACWTGNLKLLRLLIANGGNIHLKTKFGLTALDIAAAHGNLSIVEELFKYKLEINTTDNYGKTALITAVFHGYAEVVDLLLSNGANPNAVIETDEKYISPLLLAVQALDLELIKTLKKQGADIHQKINKKNANLTIFEFIKSKYGNQREIYEKIREIISELPPLASFVSFAKQKTKQKISIEKSQEYSTPVLDDQALNPRKYLLSIGYSQELIDEFEEERKSNKKRLKQTPYSGWQLGEKKKEEVVSLLNGKILSSHDAIVEIDSAGSEKVFCYLDRVNLEKQGCDPSKIRNRRLKFDGYHLKKLDKEKGTPSDWIKLSDNEEAKEIRYTHELKINKVDRILLIKEGPLYMGVRYIPGGFHTLSSITSFNSSTKKNHEPLEIQWPPDIVKRNDSKQEFKQI